MSKVARKILPLLGSIIALFGCGGREPPHSSSVTTQHAASIGEIPLETIVSQINGINNTLDPGGTFDGNAGVQIAKNEFDFELHRALDGGISPDLANYNVWLAGQTWLNAKNITRLVDLQTARGDAALARAQQAAHDVIVLLGSDFAITSVYGATDRQVFSTDSTGLHWYTWTPKVEVWTTTKHGEELRGHLPNAMDGVPVEINERDPPSPTASEIAAEVATQKGQILADEVRARYGSDPGIARVWGDSQRVWSNSQQRYLDPTPFIWVGAKDGDAANALEGTLPSQFKGAVVVIQNDGPPAMPTAMDPNEVQMLADYEENKAYYYDHPTLGRVGLARPGRDDGGYPYNDKALYIDLLLLDRPAGDNLLAHYESAEQLEGALSRLSWGGTL